jgi:hypothetical protein
MSLMLRQEPGVMAGLMRGTLLAATCLALVACASQRLPSRMELPPALADQPLLPVGPVGSSREGQFAWEGEHLSFIRSASRDQWDLAVFRSNGGMALLRLQWQRGSEIRELHCSALHKQVDVLGLRVEKPWHMECQWQGDDQPSLQLREGEGRGLSGYRAGEYRRGALVLKLRSIHRQVQNPIPLGVQGYVIEHDGRALAAVDLSGDRPQIVRTAAGDTLARRAASDLALALALAWEPIRN